jgi:DNA/RNA endonuclease YhcR with UshA esterase domain
MNKISKIIAALFIVLGTTFLWSCVKEKHDTPTITAPTVAFSANATIATINQLADSLATLTPAFGIINKDLIIEGVVVGNDESGNIYKNLYIEDNTGGIDIAIELVKKL